MLIMSSQVNMAVFLVFLTMLIFLQSFRATLIPTLVMPVALIAARVTP